MSTKVLLSFSVTVRLMSAPVYEFTCTACDFNGLYASGTGERVYLLPDGSSVPVPWDTGWCSNCQTIRRIQRGMSPPELEAECGRLKMETKSKHGREVGNWKRLIHRLTVEYPLTSCDLDRGRKLLAVLAGRTSLMHASTAGARQWRLCTGRQWVHRQLSCRTCTLAVGDSS